MKAHFRNWHIAYVHTHTHTRTHTHTHTHTHIYILLYVPLASLGIYTYSTCFLLVEYSSIDWHDFVVVETINFRENETGQLVYC